MSADNWAVCPKCEKLGLLGLGRGPLNMFREDYEFWLDRDGVVNYSYSGRCEDCGFGISFNGQQQIPGMPS